MTIQEFALKYDVPMPETCQILNWKYRTIVYWVIEKKTQLQTIIHFAHIKEFENSEDYEDYIVIPTPNAQILFGVLPKTIEYGTGLLFWNFTIDLEHKLIYFKSIHSKENIFEVEIQNNNLADALAKLYILLRENNLLPIT